MIHRPVVGERCEGPRDGPPEGPVVHTHGSVALMLRGRGVMHMGSAWTVEAGDVFLVPEGAPHYRVDDVVSDYIGVGVCMSCLPAGGWGPTLRALFLAVGEGACPVLRVDEADRVELAHTLRSLQASPDPGAPWLIEARLGVLTALLRRATPAAAARPQDSPVVARALDHIARHALEPLSLVDVARAVGRAPSHLATRVKAETGESVGAWIAQARMAQARLLLLRGDDTVDVIAEKVGYSSASHFHRTFKRMHGLSPVAWRAEHPRGVDVGGARQGRGPAGEHHGPGHHVPHGHVPHGHGHSHSHGHSHGHGHAAGMARGLDDPSRDAWQRPEHVLRAMDLSPTMRVADVGAGTGYFAVRLARALPQGEVIATDVDPERVQHMKERAEREGLGDLRVALAPPSGSGLPPEGVDRVLVVHVWHHHPDPAAFARELAAALGPGGRLFVVDFAVDAQRGPPPSMRVAPERVIADLEAAGLSARLVALELPDQYVVEGRRGVASRDAPLA